MSLFVWKIPLRRRRVLSHRPIRRVGKINFLFVHLASQHYGHHPRRQSLRGLEVMPSVPASSSRGGEYSTIDDLLMSWGN